MGGAGVRSPPLPPAAASHWQSPLPSFPDPLWIGQHALGRRGLQGEGGSGRKARSLGRRGCLGDAGGALGGGEASRAAQ